MSARKSTKFPGVQARESADRRYRGRPDICYTIDYRDETGKRVRKDVGWASEGFTAALASEMRNRLIHEAKTQIAMHGVPLPSRRTLTLQGAWEKYRDDWLIPNGKDSNGPEGLIRTHLRDMLVKPLNLIDSYEIDKLMNKMSVAGLAPQTVKHAVGLLKRIFRRMRLWRLYSGPMPFEGLKIPRPDNARERFLSPQEANDLLNELKKHSVQTWAISLVSLHCGLRFGEIARLVWGDIDFEGSSIFIARSKNGCSRRAVMTSEVKEALLGLSPGRKTELVFPGRGGAIMASISKSFFRAVDKLGFNVDASDKSKEAATIKDRRRRVVFHTLRHTYASWLAMSGQGQFVIADRLGHHSLAMTMRYTHLMDETRKASAEAISKIFHAEPPESQS